MNHLPPSLVPSAEQTELCEAIEQLYSVFKRYRLKSPVDGCPHCVSDEDSATLESKPLRQLLADDLSRYAAKALTTWGSLNDFKHFLPRVCELIAWRQNDGFDMEIALGKLAYGQWRRWLETERDAVHGYLTRLWRHALSMPATDENDIDTCLCSIARADEVVESYLDYWRTNSRLQPALQLAAFIARNHGSLLKHGELTNAFWEGPADKKVIAWLCEPATGEQLDAAFFHAPDDASRLALSQAAERWSWLRVRCGGINA